ncbi:MAG: ParB N-terminal domain-containing protein [Bdellovibrionaceae bacterium]|nr:ParB N-terminal domain-containing protein [Pseudobdellovibrionaceae bacterium]
MNTIPLSSILIPEDRQRKQKSPAVADIAQSILSDGMFHALVLQPDNKTLIAGHTRYEALRSLPEGFKFITMANSFPRTTSLTLFPPPMTNLLSLKSSCMKTSAAPNSTGLIAPSP